MSQGYIEQPLEFITNTTTMNGSDDTTALAENEVVLIQNFVKTKKVYETRLGKTALNGGGGEGLIARCYGLSTFDPLDSDTKQYVVVVGGVIYAGSSFPLSSKLSGMTTSTVMRLLPFDGKMLINDPSQGMAWYDGTNVGWCGIPSPRENKLIDDFESITTWSTTNGTVAVDDSVVLHGRHGLKFKATSGLTYAPRKTITVVDLTSFPSAPIGDGASSTINDVIRLQLIRSFKTDFTSLNLVIQSSTNNWSYVVLSDLPEWQNNDTPGLLFDILVRKSAFIAGVGTLNWGAVTVIGFDIFAATGKTPFIICDWLRLERGAPIVKELGKMIGDFESDETWVGATNFDYKYKASLARSLMLGQNESTYRSFSPVLNLTTLTNGDSVDAIDSIEIKVAKDTSKVAGTLTLTFRDTPGAVTKSYSINATDILTPDIGSTPIQKVKDPSLVFQKFTIRRDLIVTGGGSIDWASIDRCTLTASNHVGTYYVDSLKLVRTKDRMTLVDFESSTDTPVVTGAIESGWCDPNKDPYRSDEGSTESFYVKIGASTECTIDVTFSPDKDMSQYTSGAAVQDGDLIGPYLWISKSKNLEEVSLFYDTDTGGFNTGYYVKKLLTSGGQIPEVKKDWFSLRFERREHEQQPPTGATGTWVNVDKVRIKIVTSKEGGVECYLDKWLIQRGEALSGRFWYAVTYRNSRGARSELSNISAPVEVRGAGIMLSNLPVSTGCIREVWRLGGSKADWYLAGVIGDDESTYFEDFLQEEELTEILPTLYQQPMITKTFCLYDNLLIRANLTELSGGYRHKTLIEIGKEGSIDEVKDVFEVGKEDGFEIVSVIPAFDRIFVMKEKGVASFDPTNLTQKPIWHSHEMGMVGERAWAFDPKGTLYFVGVDKRIWAFNGQSFDDEIGKGVELYTSQIPNAYVGKVEGCFFEQYVLFAVTATGGTENSLILCFDVKEKSWSVFTNWATSLFHVQSYLGAFSLIGIDTNTILFTYFSGNTDAGSAITGVITTADKSKDPTITNQPASLFFTGRALSSTSVTITIEPYYDLTDSGDDIVLTVSDQTHKREAPIGVPSPGFWPTYLGFKVTSTLGRVAIRSLAYARREEERS